MASVLWVLAAALVCVPLVVQSFRSFGRAAAVLSVVVAATAIAVPAVSLKRAFQEQTAPIEARPVAYATSTSCKKCHADHYESWHRTYHRTMTQEATPAAVMGDFDDVSVEHKGLPCRLFREGDRFFMELVDPGWERALLARGDDPSRHANPPRVTYTVDRLVGSHNRQVYLTRRDDGSYVTLPLIWHPGERRWITESGAILMPPSRELYSNPRLWNRTCVRCHNTYANPGMIVDPAALELGSAWATQVAELGIACEACHGPAAQHVAANRDPLRRYSLASSRGDDATIVNPLKLSKQRSVELCGRCHGNWIVKPELQNAWLTRGQFFRPGQPLERYHLHSPKPGRPEKYTADFAGNYWPDWTPRPSAHDYEGVLLSPCYQRGEMTCLSCHSMHDSDPNDQLRFPENPDTSVWESNQACLQCHDAYEDTRELTAHTHHGAASPGSRCYNCHMPFQQYGLGKPIRTHRIAQPDAAVSAASGLSNACNQCHADRSLAWTAEWLAEWYAHPLPELTDDQRRLSSTVVDLLAGDAFARAVAATRLGWPEAEQAAPGLWRVPLLAHAMEDSYEVVRLLSYTALRQQPGFEDLTFDYLAPAATRRRQLEAIRRRWTEQPPLSPSDRPPAVPLAEDGWAAQEEVDRLRAKQDRTEVYLAE